MKVALGMIIKSLDSHAEILGFVENAEKYGHKLDCVIVAYTLRLDPLAAKKINEKIPLYAIDINSPRFSAEQFRRRGISERSANTLLKCPMDTSRGLVPYGHNRNIVIIEAILRGADILVFADSDVSPEVLKKAPSGLVHEETDFFKAHFAHLDAGASVTSCEYSGYNILPPASFDGMEDLLLGLQKSDMYGFWRSSETHRSLRTQPDEPRVGPCKKILGGNVAIKLSVFSGLPPFFSAHYSVGGELFLCRWEDTILGSAIIKHGVDCVETGVFPMHDTFLDFPKEPDLRGDPAVQERFFYACTGWVGRNPFLNFIRGEDTDSIREFQREKLERGICALAEYTSNPIYHGVIRNFDASLDSLVAYVERYEKVLEAWDEFIGKAF